jgi:hypothetical protein
MISKESRQHTVLDEILDGSSPDYISASTTQAVWDLNKHKQEVFLTGSRFFGTHRRRSDFDFYTHYSVDMVSYLQKVDFEEARDSAYNDALTDHVFCKGRVHIQLVKDIVIKRQIQRALADHDVIKRIGGHNKRLQTRIWRAMMDVALGTNGTNQIVKVVPAGKYCSCPGEKVQRTIDGHTYYSYCQGCGKEYIP